MEDGFQLHDSTIAIIGLGLMGGSLAMALRGKCAALYGVDSDRATLKLALDKKIVDQVDTDPGKLLPQADLVIVATPILAIIDFIRKLPSLTQNSCIVLDLGSAKQDIVQVMAMLPERFDPIGGHPICGKENLGLANAEGHLFQDAPFVITPLKRTASRAHQAAKQIISAIGANLIEIDAEEHDQALAFTSHLPFLLSSALALSTPTEYSSLIGSGFRSTSRLAATPSSMMLGVLQSNRENVLEALSAFQQKLSEIQEMLASTDFQTLKDVFRQSRAAYQALITDH